MNCNDRCFYSGCVLLLLLTIFLGCQHYQHSYANSYGHHNHHQGYNHCSYDKDQRPSASTPHASAQLHKHGQTYDFHPTTPKTTYENTGYIENKRVEYFSFLRHSHSHHHDHLHFNTHEIFLPSKGLSISLIVKDKLAKERIPFNTLFPPTNTPKPLTIDRVQPKQDVFFITRLTKLPPPYARPSFYFLI